MKTGFWILKVVNNEKERHIVDAPNYFFNCQVAIVDLLLFFVCLFSRFHDLKMRLIILSVVFVLLHYNYLNIQQPREAWETNCVLAHYG